MFLQASGEDQSMTKVFIYSIPFLFPANRLLSLYPFTFSKLCLNSHFNFLPTLPFFHVSLIAVLFEKGSCLCLHSVCISVSRTSMSPIPKSNYIVWEKNLIMALRMLVLHERKKKTLKMFYSYVFHVSVFITHTWEINSADH